MPKARFWNVRCLTSEGEVSSWDAQKARLYGTEKRFWDDFDKHGLKIGPRDFHPLDPVQGRTLEAVECIKRNQSNHALLAAWDAQPFYVVQPRPSDTSLATGRASKRKGRIYIGGAAPFWVLLHEVAHVVAPARVKHNWPFVIVYLELVRGLYGTKAWRMLRKAFRDANVRYKPVLRREVTPERLKALQQGAAKARQARWDKARALAAQASEVSTERPTQES